MRFFETIYVLPPLSIIDTLPAPSSVWAPARESNKREFKVRCPSIEPNKLGNLNLMTRQFERIPVQDMTTLNWLAISSFHHKITGIQTEKYDVADSRNYWSRRWWIHCPEPRNGHNDPRWNLSRSYSQSKRGDLFVSWWVPYEDTQPSCHDYFWCRPCLNFLGWRTPSSRRKRTGVCKSSLVICCPMMDSNFCSFRFESRLYRRSFGVKIRGSKPEKLGKNLLTRRFTSAVAVKIPSKITTVVTGAVIVVLSHLLTRVCGSVGVV